MAKLSILYLFKNWINFVNNNTEHVCASIRALLRKLRRLALGKKLERMQKLHVCVRQRLTSTQIVVMEVW